MPRHGDALEAGPGPVTRERRGGSPLLAVLLVLLALAAGVAVAALNESRPSRYASSTDLLLDQPRALTYSQNEGVVAKLSQLRFKYAGLVTTTTFARAVAADLDVPAGKVHAALVPAVVPNTLLLRVTATTGGPETSRQIAQRAGEELQTRLAQEQEAEHVPADLRLVLTQESPAERGTAVSPSRRRSLQLGIGVFLAVLIGGGLLRDLARRRTTVADPLA